MIVWRRLFVELWCGRLVCLLLWVGWLFWLVCLYCFWKGVSFFCLFWFYLFALLWTVVFVSSVVLLGFMWCLRFWFYLNDLLLICCLFVFLSWRGVYFCVLCLVGCWCRLVCWVFDLLLGVFNLFVIYVGLRLGVIGCWYSCLGCWLVVIELGCWLFYGWYFVCVLFVYFTTLIVYF